MMVKPATQSHRRIVGRQIASGRPDDAGEFQFVVEGVAAMRRMDGIAVANNRDGVREVEDGDLIPLRHHLEPAVHPACLDVLLEGVKIANVRGEAEVVSYRMSPQRHNVRSAQSNLRRQTMRT